MTENDIKYLITQMTLEEKVSFLSGGDSWHTKSLERLDIPMVMVADGPHGLRKQEAEGDNLGMGQSIEAICYPCACATAASFSRDTLYMMGQALGEECKAESVNVILGPGANIKRSPLCGRNFEYFSEDPYLSSEMSAAHIQGVQSKNIGSSLKHYLANNQETRRFTCSSNVDERTLREIYLASFEGAIKRAKPWTVMCSYNRVNGEQVSGSKRYLTDILRKEWGFDGVVVSDWGAVYDRVDGVRAGLDLEMPSSQGAYDSSVIQAIHDGYLKESDIDICVERILKLIYQCKKTQQEQVSYDKDAHHMIAKKVAEETAVLLKNDGILPLKKNQKIVFLGVYAKKPRYQGGGSSHINSYKVVSAYDVVENWDNVSYFPGFEDNTNDNNENLLTEAVNAAMKADVAVIFAGLPDSFESEGYDRTHMQIPDCQIELIRRVTSLQKKTVVVLHNGSPIEMPWIDDVNAVLEVYLGGQAVGESTVDILFGKVNPSGKLAETFPLHMEDNPSYLNFPGEGDEVNYAEGIFVGYRYYDKKKMPVLFPFGHGLSYTTFEYSNLQLSNEKIKDIDTLTVSVDITNTGEMAGKEVVQLYVADKESTVIRPIKELKGFEKIELHPDETRTVKFLLNKRAFAYYNTEIQDWHVESGKFEIMVGHSSRDIVLSKEVYVESTEQIPIKITPNTLMSDLKSMVHGEDMLNQVVNEFTGESKQNSNIKLAPPEGMKDMVYAMMNSMPIRGILSFGKSGMTKLEFDEMIKELELRKKN